MKTLTKRIFAITGALALGLTAVHAQSDGALLDALVTKGVLSDQEAEDIRANEAKDYASTPAGKLSISDHVTNLKLYGDGRLRYEYLDEKAANAVAAIGSGPHTTTTERYRYRIRVGADYTFTDNFKAGFELESATAADSANQSFGSEYGKFPINVGLIYLQWKPFDFLTLTGGKQKNPLYTTDLVWDPDVNPEGGAEQFSWTIPVDFGSDAPVSSDPKAVVAPAEPSTCSLTVGLTAGQFIYADNNEATLPPAGGVGGVAKTDIWVFAEQIPVQFNWDKNTFAKIVPGIMTYSGGGFGVPGTVVPVTTVAAGTVGSVGNGSAGTFSGTHAASNLNMILAPGEVDWTMWDLPFKTYWDFSYNIDGKDRIQNTYLGNGTGNGGSNVVTAAQLQNRSLGDSIAWLAGLQVGQNKKKGDWSIKADYRQVGLGAVDPNINDSDFGDSFLNQQGVKVQSVYNFTDFLTGSLTYFNTWSYKNNLYETTGTGGTPGANLSTPAATERVQVDIIWKF